MRTLLILAFLQTAWAEEPLRSGCSPDSSQLATVGPSDQVKVLLAQAGWDSPCYKLTLIGPGQNLSGYVLGNALPAIQEFQRQREQASAAATEAQARLALAQATAVKNSAEPEAGKPKDPLISTKFEDFSGRDLKGKPVSLSGLNGRVTVVTFWSPTSASSQNELMRVMPLYNQLHKSGLAAVGISMDPNGNHIGTALDDRSPTWPQIPDRSGLAAQYNVDARSGKTFVLDASHHVVAAGPMGPEIEKAVRQLLAAP
jgi:peroxiredoxin